MLSRSLFMVFALSLLVASPVCAMQNQETLQLIKQAAKAGNRTLVQDLVENNPTLLGHVRNSNIMDEANGDALAYLVDLFYAPAQTGAARQQPAQAPRPASGQPRSVQIPTRALAPLTAVAAKPAQSPAARVAPARTQAAAPALSPSTLTQKSNCTICLDEKTNSEMCTLQCKHAFCKECLNGVLSNASNAVDLKCPNPSCKQQLSEADIATITDNDREKRAAVADLKLKEWESKQGNAKQCPTPNCKFVYFKEDNVPGAFQCPQCNAEYCAECLIKHDAAVPCARAAQAKNMSKEDKASEEWKQRNTKPCPQCQTAIEKSEGCNHMTCEECRYQFCWVCLRPWAENHYACRNANVRQAAQPAQPQQFAQIQPNLELAEQDRAAIGLNQVLAEFGLQPRQQPMQQRQLRNPVALHNLNELAEDAWQF